METAQDSRAPDFLNKALLLSNQTECLDCQKQLSEKQKEAASFIKDILSASEYS
jgi:hypothetical protein